MKCLALLSALALLPSTLSATIYMAGDSTMAKNGGGGGTDGKFPAKESICSIHLNALIKQDGVSTSPPTSPPQYRTRQLLSRSARSYTREGRFQAIADVLNPGDYVVIEFGHNDGGSLSPTDNGRTGCPGTGDETCTTTYNGVQETVLTFPNYLENAAKLFVCKGAKVLISSQMPNNPWETGTFSYSASRFVGYAKLAAQTAGVDYVDHGAYVADRFESLGKSTHIFQMTTPIPALSELKLLQTLSSRL